jgi:hypothetical protein
MKLAFAVSATLALVAGTFPQKNVDGRDKRVPSHDEKES